MWMQWVKWECGEIIFPYSLNSKSEMFVKDKTRKQSIAYQCEKMTHLLASRQPSASFANISRNTQRIIMKASPEVVGLARPLHSRGRIFAYPHSLLFNCMLRFQFRIYSKVELL